MNEVSRRIASLFVVSLSLGALAGPVGCSGGGTEEEGTSEGAATGVTSGYTSIAPADCKAIETFPEEEGGGGTSNCGGMGGFELISVDGDARSNVEVKAGNKRFDLSVWTRDGFGGFSHLGPKAEWRGTKNGSAVNPYALIFRYFVTNGDGKERSSLIVARVSKDGACIVDTVSSAVPDHSVKARQIADANRDLRCPGTSAGPDLNASVYTELKIGECKVTRRGAEEEGSSVETDCGGHDGYRLLVDEGDLRQFVTVASGKQTREQGSALQHQVTGGFSTVGPKAEWRVTGPEKTAHALIFRFTEKQNVGNDTEGRDHQYMIVSKVTRERSCVTDIIDVRKHAADHSALARVAADAASGKRCPAQRPEPR